MYNANLFRPRDTSDFEITCKGITIHYHPGRQRGYVMMARALKDRGYPDGPITFTEIKTRKPLIHSFPSVYALAERPINWSEYPLTASDTVSEKPVADEVNTADTSSSDGALSANALMALRRVLDDASAWGTLPGRTKGVLVDRGMVVPQDKTRAIVTEAGRTALANADANPVAEVPTFRGKAVSEKQVEALKIVIENPAGWSGVGIRTKGFMVAENWVCVVDQRPYLTDTGREVAALVGLDTSAAPEAPAVAEPRQERREKAPAPAPQADTGALGKPLTPRQIDAIKVVINRPKRWPDVHGRTRNYMTDSGWVALDPKGLPTLTETGKKVAAMVGLI